MGDFIFGVIFLALIVFVIDFESNSRYYDGCLLSGHSYVRCFYDHVLKPD